MLGNVCDWAGDFRKTDKNIGVDKNYISIRLIELCDDIKYWIENDIYPADEIATRFHHRLVLMKHKLSTKLHVARCTMQGRNRLKTCFLSTIY